MSEIYSGDNIETIPAHNPPTIRQIINAVKLPEMVHPIAEIANSIAERNKAFFRPKKSAIIPAKETPMIQPSKAESTNQPSIK